MQRYLSGMLRVVNLKSVLISALAVLSTWISLQLGFKANFPLTLIATAIVFPLVFSINTAYNRREKSLEEYGAFKANGRAMALAARRLDRRRSRPRRGSPRRASPALLRLQLDGHEPAGRARHPRSRRNARFLATCRG